MDKSGHSIAIVGIGCRFPGAGSPGEFWEVLRNGSDVLAPIPKQRFDAESLHDPMGAPGSTLSLEGGFLDAVDEFDAAFFGISPREATSMDPQQRIFLETSWEAIEDAGIDPKSLSGTETGVFVGLEYGDYEDLLIESPEAMDLYSNTGGFRSAVPGRVSWFFGLQGPSLAIDTACSSGLVAIHYGCRSLRSGESELALVGSTNVILHPAFSIGFSSAKMLSPQSRCRFGDATGNGFVRSEGVATLVLKRLDDALRDGDPIRGIIEGSAVNNDGRTGVSMATPGHDGQVSLLRSALKDARVEPAEISLIEAHGTGTAVGDPVELGAVGAVYGEGRLAPCPVGSVKTNIGHCEASSGVAGLIKVILALSEEEIPASLHHSRRNPSIPWDDLRVRVATTLESWPRSTSPRYAGVSAFGIGGTNAHVILRESPRVVPISTKEVTRAEILPFSAASEGALEQARLDLLGHVQIQNGTKEFSNTAHSLSLRKAHHSLRRFVVSDSAGGAAEQLKEQLDTAKRVQGDRVAFVFPGQGSQWLGMGIELWNQEPVFSETLEQCEAAIKRFGGWSLMQVLSADEQGSRLQELDVVQPAIFALQLGIAALWRNWGIEPWAVVGHSLGEVAAACVAGRLSLEEGAQVICGRSALVKRTTGQGGMWVVGLSPPEAEESLARCGIGPEVGTVAAWNGPQVSLVSGIPEGLKSWCEQLEKEGTFLRKVAVEYASHCSQMDRLLPELHSSLAGVGERAIESPELPRLWSTVEEGFKEGNLDAAYWCQNLRDPVQFWPGVEDLSKEGVETFLEISPHPVLSATIHEGLGGNKLVTSSLRRERPERASMLQSLGELYTAGHDPNWEAVAPQGDLIPLPSYPWQRERHWLDRTNPRRRRSNEHPWIDSSLWASNDPESRYFEFELDTEAFPFLADHRVGDRGILPFAGFVEFSLGAAAAQWGRGALTVLRSVEVTEPLYTDETATVQLWWKDLALDKARVRWASRRDSEEPWKIHGSALLTRSSSGVPTSFVSDMASSWVAVDSMTPISGEEHRARMSDRELHYGPCFSAVSRFWRGDSTAWAETEVPAALSSDLDGYCVHPALLDAFLQVAEAALPDVGAPFVPTALEEMTFKTPWAPGPKRIRATTAPQAAGYTARVEVIDANGDLCGRIEGLTLTRLGDDRSGSECLYELEWCESDPSTPMNALQQALASEAESARRWILVGAQGDPQKQLRSQLEKAGVSVEGWDPESTKRIDSLLGTGSTSAAVRLVFLGMDFRSSGPETPELVNQSCACFLDCLQALAACRGPAEMVLVTRKAQSEAPSTEGLIAGPLWGLARVASQEQPELGCRRIDIGEEQDGEAELLLEEMLRPDATEEVALDSGRRFERRLRKNGLGESLLPARGRRFSATVQKGSLDSVGYTETRHCELEPGEVEVEVAFAGLNFRDVLLALGELEPSRDRIELGFECSGRVSAIGAGAALEIGDEVMAFGFGTLASHVRVPSELCSPIPGSLSLEAASKVPVVFSTAYRGLMELARLREGQRVLIHNGAGGVGLAAIQIAMNAGAIVYTTAGTPEKRQWLRSLGCPSVYDSRSTEFLHQIELATDGRGVDVVLSAMTGELREASLSALRPGGCFVELAKLSNGPAFDATRLDGNLTYITLDLACLMQESPGDLGSTLDQVAEGFRSQRLKPLPSRAFPVGDTSSALRYMADPKRQGVACVDLTGHESQLITVQNFSLASPSSVLVTGGLGGLGLEVADWLADRGVNELILTSRHQPPASALARIDSIRSRGVKVTISTVDVADGSEMRALIEGTRGSDFPLKGVIHAAGILDDALLGDQSSDSLRNAMAPKVAGAWWLDALTRDFDLEFFVLYSSVAGILGLGGQANYAAANVFLDGLARERQALGLAATSIQWGPWSEIGMAAESDSRGARLSDRGLGSLGPAEGIEILEKIMIAAPSNQVAMRFDARGWAESSANPPSLISELFRPGTQTSSTTETADWWIDGSSDPLEAATEGVRNEVSRVLRLAPSQIDVEQPLGEVGLDSLMGVELRGRLERATGIQLSSTTVFNYPSVVALASHLVERSDLRSEEEVPAHSKSESESEPELEAELLRTLERLEAKGIA